MKSLLCRASLCLSLGLTSTFLTTHANADSERAIDHGPIGVMGDHFHKAGERMVSARLMRMNMSGNQLGDDKLSDSEVIMQPNAAGRMPAVLSVVPQDMDMDMLMLGAMYAPSDRLTLMAMVMASSKDMALTSYTPPNMMNPTPRTVVGGFSISSDDIQSISLSGLFRLQQNASTRSHLTVGLEQSIADTDATDTVLTPMGMNMTMRLPYGMQIGDESLRLKAALTHVYSNEEWVFGGQISGKFKVAAEDWHFGDSQQATVWAQREMNRRLSLSGRLTYERASGLEGMDAMIMAPVQTAIPANYGYKKWRIGLGANGVVSLFPGQSERLGIELELPIDTDTRGVQMTPEWQLTLGIQKAF
jgi:hypothetical protein